jgi:hypothetical protein
MKKITCVLAILAAASTAAVAKDLKQDQKAQAPGVAATQMNDDEMDRVTAGAANTNPGLGNDTACSGTGGLGTCNFPAADARQNHFFIIPGSGQNTVTK